MVSQFRQIGVPDARRTNSEIRNYLRRIQQRVESLLNRTRLPRPATLLRVIDTLHETSSAAYRKLPLQRLKQLSGNLEALRDDVECRAFLSQQDDLTYRQLQRVYSDVTGLLVDLTETKPKKNREDDEIIKKFFEKAAERGWRVPDAADLGAQEEHDGFFRSWQYINKVAVDHDNLLDPDTDFGITEGAIILRTEQPIPEATLTRWAQHPLDQDVYVVFGQYVVLTHCRFLGLRSDLALVDDGPTVDLNQFISISAAIGNGTSRHLIGSPRRIKQHYYCPVINIAAADRKYFKTWDLLLKEQNDTKNRNRWTTH